MKQYQQACVGGFIKNNTGQVLFVRRSINDDFLPGKWELPGGGVDFGENPEEALKREIKEEVGLDIEIVKPLSVGHYFMEKPGEKIQRVETTFLCVMTNPSQSIVLSNEHSQYQWVSEEKYLELQLTEFMKSAVNSCWKNL